MNINSINEKIFKVLSILPLLWIGTLYLFTLACTISLGHFPVPSFDDPKYIGFDLLYYIVWYGFILTLFSPILWIVSLIFLLKNKSFLRKYFFLFILGVIISACQILFDPFEILNWYLD